jgi:hypothetical protein
MLNDIIGSRPVNFAMTIRYQDEILDVFEISAVLRYKIYAYYKG